MGKYVMFTEVVKETNLQRQWNQEQGSRKTDKTRDRTRKNSVACGGCGEPTAEAKLHTHNEEIFCPGCYAIETGVQLY